MLGTNQQRDKDFQHLQKWFVQQKIVPNASSRRNQGAFEALHLHIHVGHLSTLPSLSISCPSPTCTRCPGKTSHAQLAKKPGYKMRKTSKNHAMLIAGFRIFRYQGTIHPAVRGIFEFSCSA